MDFRFLIFQNQKIPGFFEKYSAFMRCKSEILFRRMNLLKNSEGLNSKERRCGHTRQFTKTQRSLVLKKLIFWERPNPEKSQERISNVNRKKT